MAFNNYLKRIPVYRIAELFDRILVIRQRPNGELTTRIGQGNLRFVCELRREPHPGILNWPSQL